MASMFNNAFDGLPVMSTKTLTFITVGLLVVAIILLMIGFFMDSVMLYVFGGIAGVACIGLGVYTGYKAMTEKALDMTVNAVVDGLTSPNDLDDRPILAR